MITLILYGALICSGLAEQVILKPSQRFSGPDAALIFISGAQIPPEAYIPMFKQVQNHSEGIQLWIAAPQFIADLAVIGVDLKIAQIKQDLIKQGFPQNGKFMLAGHSLGSAQIQGHAVNHPNDYQGMILMSGPINRKFRNLDKEIPVPTLTLVGEVDGLVRMSRIAESVQTQMINPPKQDWKNKFPVVLIPGINHMSFGSGNPPAAVKQRDLKLEVSESEAHDLIGKYTGEFIQQVLLKKTSSLISSGTEWTFNYVKPIIDALDLEGFTHFKPLCSENSCSAACYCGSPWVSKYAQPIISGSSSNIKLDVQFSPSSAPKVVSHSPAPCTTSCSVSLATDSWVDYAFGDDLDTGFTPTAADEIAAKLVSRAEISKALGILSNDQTSTCSEINQKAWQYALDHASPRALSRFQSLGISLSFAPDSEVAHLLIGSELAWKASKLSMTLSSDSSTQLVTSPSLSIEPGKFCKLLSPARALEWLYTDSLHVKDSI